ncbi:MAG: ABC transporter substrate-binding protein, partial [Rhodobacteraceae bacterium]|nr:ABC transporter substrate-binding protein [Paracoccaceae bacterium]
DVAKSLVTAGDGEIYVLPSMVNVQQIYFRRDILDAAGISTEQPGNWRELIDRAKEVKDKTGAYGLLFPAGVTWGGGAFGEGFTYLIMGSSTPQIANDDGTLNLKGPGIMDVFGVYEELIANDLMPIDPLLGPEPWIIPKYEMFPAGELAATTCGTWCYIYDWGPESRNPIPNVTDAVGTWAVPGQDGGQYVLVDIDSPWGVNADAADVDKAKQVLLELGSVEVAAAYAEKLGNIPARKDAADNADFQALKALVPIHMNVDDGVFLKTATGFSVVSEGVARATEALLRGETDAAGAQAILVEYATDLLGEDVVK